MSIKDKIKKITSEGSFIIKLPLWIYNHLPFNNSLKLRSGKANINCAYLKNNKFNFRGTGNKIKIENGSRLTNCNVYVSGNNNKILIDKFCYLNGVTICIEDDNNEVIIGEHSSFQDSCNFSCIEGTKLIIGKDCMFSANISIRTGDSHSVVNANDGERINPSKNVAIGDHVWVANTVIITKGVTLPSHTIVGTGSVVTRSFEDGYIAIGGNPAKVIKTSVSWERQRLPMKE